MPLTLARRSIASERGLGARHARDLVASRGELFGHGAQHPAAADHQGALAAHGLMSKAIGISIIASPSP